MSHFNANIANYLALLAMTDSLAVDYSVDLELLWMTNTLHRKFAVLAL